MRLIQQGFYSFQTQKCTCALCKSVYEVDESDIKIKTRQVEEGMQWDSYTVTEYEAFWTCPQCTNSNKLSVASADVKLLLEKRLRQEADARARGNRIP